MLRAAVGRYERRVHAVLPQIHGWRGGLGPLLRVFRPLLGVLRAEAVRRRRAATTNLFEQRTESMLVVLLSGFGSRVAGGMRHSWLHWRSALVVRAPPRRLRRPTRRLRRPTRRRPIRRVIRTAVLYGALACIAYNTYIIFINGIMYLCTLFFTTQRPHQKCGVSRRAPRMMWGVILI